MTDCLKEISINDIDVCVDLFLEVFYSEPFNYNFLERSHIFRYFKDLYNTPNFIGLIYLENGCVTGFVLGLLVDYFSANTFEIKEIIISRDAQGKGHGKKLIAMCEKYLKNYDVKAITLATNKDLKAYDFYIKNQFVVSDCLVLMSKAF